MAWLSHSTAVKNKNNTKRIVCQASWCPGTTMRGLLLQRWGPRPPTWLSSLKLRIWSVLGFFQGLTRWVKEQQKCGKLRPQAHCS
jgi:hypothetical protein